MSTLAHICKTKFIFFDMLACSCCLDFVVYSDKDDKPKVLSHKPCSHITLWDGSKNYYGFVVDKFCKLVHTIKSQIYGLYQTAGHGLK